MAEYYTVLKRAVGSLDPNVADARRAVYDKARNALIGQLKAVEPPLTTAEISRQRLELEEAIRRVERETAAGVIAAAAAPAPRSAPPPQNLPMERQLPPADQMGDVPPSPQDVFRRAMQEAGMRGAEGASRMERIPVRARADAGPLGPPELRQPIRDRAPPEPPYRGEQNYRNEPPHGREAAYSRDPAYGREPAYEPEPDYPPQERVPPRLAPDYDQDWERDRDRGAAPPPPPPGPSVDRRDRPALAGKTRRRGYLEEEDQQAFERPARRSRLPGFILLILILGMIGGLGALAWSQRAVITDLLAQFDSGGSGPGPSAPSETPEVPADPASNKITDRVGGAPPPDDPAKEVRLVEPADGAPALPAAATADGAPAGDTQGAQKAILYEEPVDGGSNGVTAINASVTWRFVENGPNGPELEASLDVPERGMKIKFSLHKNADETLPASHLVEVVVDTPAEFPGKGIRSVPRLVLKPTEESRGQPLVGAAAKVADGFFWIALSAAPADVTSNIGLLRERNWIDLPLVYETGQRAILTFEKGTPGDRVFDQAVTAWNAG